MTDCDRMAVYDPHECVCWQIQVDVSGDLNVLERLTAVLRVRKASLKVLNYEVSSPRSAHASLLVQVGTDRIRHVEAQLRRIVGVTTVSVTRVER